MARLTRSLVSSTTRRRRPPALTAETLRAQDALVRELAVRADALLPSRFGSHFADERALRQTLDELGAAAGTGLDARARPRADDDQAVS